MLRGIKRNRSIFSARHHLLAFTLACLIGSAASFAAPSSVSETNPTGPATALREIGLPFFDIYEPRAYGGHTQVWSAVQDAAGITYFGNFAGVLTFDGATWDRIAIPTTSFVRGLALDDQDTLWIGGVDEIGYAKTDANGQRTFFSLKEKLPAEAQGFGDVWRAWITARGPLFQAHTWLFRWTGSTFLSLRLPGEGSWQTIVAGDTIWVSNPQHGWFRLHDDGTALSLERYKRPAACDGSSLMFCIPGATKDEFIFGTTRAGLWRGTPAGFSPLKTEVDDLITQRRLYRGIRLDRDRIVLTTLQAGAFILDLNGKLLTRLDESAGLPDNGAINAFAASGDVLWLCLQRGLVRVDDRRWLSWFGPARGAPRGNLQTPLRHQDTLYLCADSGLIKLAPTTASTPAHLERVPGFTEGLMGLTPIDNGLLVYGDSRIFERHGGERTALPGVANNTFEVRAVTSQPNRWFALTNGGLHSYRRTADGWVHEGAIAGLEGVRTLAEEPDGTWWFGTPNRGVLRVTFPQANDTSPGTPTITRFSAPTGLPVGHGWVRVMVDERGPLVLSEIGFFRFDATTQQFGPTKEFGERFANGTSTSRSVITDKQGEHWIVARPAGKSELVTTIDLGVHSNRGWQSLLLPHLRRIDDITDLHYDRSDDVLWLSGQSGVIRLDLDLWRKLPPPALPRLLLSRVTTAEGTLLPLHGGWRLPFTDRSLLLRFGSPELTPDADLIFESTLVGQGAPIVSTDRTPNRSFTSLAYGDYILRLRARASNGPWSTPIEIAFTILPPWWLSGWAWAFYVVFSFALAFSFVIWRTRALQRHAARLESIVADRTEDLRRSNEELTRLHRLELDEKIAAKLGEEKARLEVLRYQLNPHFLFNALTSVCAHLPPTLTKAREIIEQLTDFCQLTLFRPAGGDNPTVTQEIKMLRAYLDIEQTRWGDLLNVELTVSPETANDRIPPLLLLPLVENALKYGRATSTGALTIRVQAIRRDRSLIIEVANTGEWVEAQNRGHVPSLGIGLENLRQRLQRYYPGAHQFTHHAANGWVTFTLQLHAPARAL